MNWFSIIGSIIILIIGGYFWYDYLEKKYENKITRIFWFIVGLPFIWFIGWIIVTILLIGIFGG